MGLFDKKYCDVCGNKIGLLGNRKLEDGNLCKECAKKLSPWFSERRHSTLDEIKAQLEYREENKQAVKQFNTTRTLGRYTKVLLDEDAQKFMVTGARDLEEANPDVLDYSQVTGCDLDVQEHSHEIMRKQGDKEVSYNPKRFEYSYDFYMNINVNHPYFDDMRFQLNSGSVKTGETRPGSAAVYGRSATVSPGALASRLNSANVNPDYAEYIQMGNEIKDALMKARKQVRDAAAAANKPKKAVKCPCCGATTIPDASGCCEYCGGSVL